MVGTEPSMIVACQRRVGRSERVAIEPDIVLQPGAAMASNSSEQRSSVIWSRPMPAPVLVASGARRFRVAMSNSKLARSKAIAFLAPMTNRTCSGPLIAPATPISAAWKTIDRSKASVKGRLTVDKAPGFLAQVRATSLPPPGFSGIRASFDRPADKGCRGGRSLLSARAFLEQAKLKRRRLRARDL